MSSRVLASQRWLDCCKFTFYRGTSFGCQNWSGWTDFDSKSGPGTNFGKIFYQNWSGQTDFRGDWFCCDSTLIGNNNNSLLQQISSLTAFQSSMVYRKQSRLMAAHGSSLMQPDRFFFFYMRLHGSELCSQVMQHARLSTVVKQFKTFHSNLTCCLAGKW